MSKLLNSQESSGDRTSQD